MAAVIFTLVVRSLFFGAVVLNIIPAVSETAAASSLFSPLSPAALTTHGNHITHVKRDDQSRFKIQSQFVADYGIWSPNPVFGGGTAAPIPHEVQE